MKVLPRGIGMWISWVSPRTADAENVSLVEQAKRAGLGWLAVKCGNHVEGEQWKRRGAELLRLLHDAGIGLFTWHYSYPDRWREEVALVRRCVELGVDGHIIDAETEWEYAPGVARFSNVRRHADAAAFVAELRAAIGDTFLAHAPIWRPQSHAEFPYVEFGSACDAVMPQAYWTAAGTTAASFCSRLDDAWRGYLAARPMAAAAIWPIGPAYGAGDWPADRFPGRILTEDLETFFQRYADRPTSLFSWEPSNAVVWQLLERWAAARTIAGENVLNRLPPDTEPPPAA